MSDDVTEWHGSPADTDGITRDLRRYLGWRLPKPKSRPQKPRFGGSGSVTFAASGCGGAGKYGYAREYAYLPGEESWARRTNDAAVYDEVRRLPDRFENQLLGWFGVVTALERAGNEWRVTMFTCS